MIAEDLVNEMIPALSMKDNAEKLGISLKRSRIKVDVLKVLARSMSTSAKIAGRIDFRSSHITVALKDLRKRKCVKLMNPHDKEPDIYRITELGKKMLSLAKEPLTRKKNKSYRRSGKRRSIS